jgi:o-succinylbenzoate synthase
MKRAQRTGGLVGAWAQIGAHGGVALCAVELWLIELPFLRPVLTSKGEHRTRPLVLVRLVAESDHRTVEGWGECAALADTTYDHEDAAHSYDVLNRLLAPVLVAEARRKGGQLPRPAALHDVAMAAPDHPLALAALEMAAADAHLRAEGRSLAGVIGVEGRSVAVGAVVGRSASADTVVTKVRDLVEQGFTRVKMKIGPAWDIEPLDKVTRAFPGLAVQADANGSYAQSDIDHLEKLDRFGLLCLEQPFDRTDLAGHARLAELIDTPICLDESVDSVDSALRALAMGACSVVCVKPSRLGGLGPAIDLVSSCTASGTAMWMGGMFESGYARGVNTALAALPGFSWPGDLSPAGGYLGRDLVPAPELERSGPGGALTRPVPGGSGMGTPPDPSRFGKYVARHHRIEAGPA